MNDIETNWLDRVPTQPGRVKVTHSGGTEEYVTVERADAPTEAGTAINRANLGVRIGEIREFANIRDDNKYLLCDGSMIKKADYPLLKIPPLLGGTETLIREITHNGEIFEAFGKWYAPFSSGGLSYSTDYGDTWTNCGVTATSNIIYDYRDEILALAYPSDSTNGRKLHVTTDGITFRDITITSSYWDCIAIFDGKIYAHVHSEYTVRIYNPTTLELINTLSIGNVVSSEYRGQIFSHAGMCAGNNCIYIETKADLGSYPYSLKRSTDGINFTQVGDSSSSPQSYKCMRIEGDAYLTNYPNANLNVFSCILKVDDNTYYGMCKSPTASDNFRKKYNSLNDAINNVNGADINSGVLVQKLNDNKYIIYDSLMSMNGTHTGSLYNIEDAKLPTSGENPKYIKVMN